jgi:hypothetical protein
MAYQGVGEERFWAPTSAPLSGSAMSLDFCYPVCAQDGYRKVMLLWMTFLCLLKFRSAKITIFILLSRRIIISGLCFFLVLLLREEFVVDLAVLGMQRFRQVATLR